MLAGRSEHIDPWDSTNVTILRDSKDKMKSSEGSGIETDQAGQSEALLNQSTKILHKNWETKKNRCLYYIRMRQ